MPQPLLLFSQSDYLVQIVDTNSHTKWQTVQIQISWLLQKPNDMDLHCLQRQGISGFRRTRVKSMHTPLPSACLSVTRFSKLSEWAPGSQESRNKNSLMMQYWGTFYSRHTALNISAVKFTFKFLYILNINISWIKWTFATMTAFVPKDVAIKMNLLF